MRKYTRDLYARLEAETGQSTGLQAGRLHRGRRRQGSPRGVPPRLRVQPLLRRRRPRDLAARRSRTCSRSRRPTTCSPASTSRRTAAPNPVDVTMALAKGARMQGATIIEGVAVTGVHDEARRGHRRAHARTATSRPSTSSTAPACGRASSAREVGVNIPLQAAEHYYLITERIPQLSRDVAGARGSGVVRLLPRGGRRPDDRPVRAGVRAVEGRAASPRTSRSARSSPTGSAWGRTSRRRWRACPISMETGVQEVLLRPGELHARPRSRSSARRPS